MKKTRMLLLAICIALLFTGCYAAPALPQGADSADIPGYSGSAYVVLNYNVPEFSKAELTTVSYEQYSERDALGRCGVAIASIGTDIMPTEERGAIGQIKPSGWHTVKYDCVDGKYLYNRCHLIGFQLTGENANENNLITGTRFMNTEGMLPFENMVADYVKETGNHVAYRVTPIFDGSNLVASGVQMEAYSVEDSGEGICFNVYCYNIQPGVTINYENGESTLSQQSPQKEDSGTAAYILNTNTKKFHIPSCSSVDSMNEENKEQANDSRDTLIQNGYSPCGNCNP